MTGRYREHCFSSIPSICCVHRRVVEGSGVGSAGCIVHVDMHGEWVVLWVAAM